MASRALWVVLINFCTMKALWAALLVAGCTSPNPLFCEVNDYHLASAKSPAVDVGVVGALIDDADGDPRSDGAPDVGADELVP
jgi:hypothetical protein